jgi:hypothetical protein
VQWSFKFSLSKVQELVTEYLHMRYFIYLLVQLLLPLNISMNVALIPY